MKPSTPANKMAARGNGYKPVGSSLLSPTPTGRQPSNGFSTPKSNFTPSMNSTPYDGSTSFSSSNTWEDVQFKFYYYLLFNRVSTPAVRYGQRSNSGQVVCSLNDANLPSSWHGNRGRHKPKISHYNETTALTEAYRYMYQTIFAKSTGKNSKPKNRILF